MLSVSCFTLLSWSVPPCEQEEMEVAGRKAQVSLGPHLGGFPVPRRREHVGHGDLGAKPHLGLPASLVGLDGTDLWCWNGWEGIGLWNI